MNAIAIEIPQLGSVQFSQSLRARRLRITIRNDKSIRITIPRRGSLKEAKEFLLLKSSWVQKQLRRIERYGDCREIGDLSNIDIEKGQEELFSRLNYFCQKYNFSYRRATFRNQKTRWGSCSGRNNINLNINLLGIPGYLQDYVLLHELVHTRHKNHGREFWGEMNNLMGDARKLDKEMRKYRIRRRKAED